MLPSVHGRIDHMAIDEKTGHLFVAELGNGSVDDIDLSSGTVAGRIAGLAEPQGVAWLAREGEIAVACGDGVVHFYETSERRQLASIRLGKDADNVRVDSRNGNVVVGFGSGALAIIDAASHRVLRELQLPAHPEAFELSGSRVFVNVPNAHAIVVADLDEGRVLKTINTGTLFGNYPMAAERGGARLAIGFRIPSSLSLLDMNSGITVRSLPVCGDADDVFFRSGALVVICGSGAVQIVEAAGSKPGVSVATQHGARTGLLSPKGDQLFVAVPAGKAPAAIWQLSFR